MRWAMMEALEERSLLSAVSLAAADERAEARVDLRLPGNIPQATPMAAQKLIVDPTRNQLLAVEPNFIKRFDAHDFTSLGSITISGTSDHADITADGKYLYLTQRLENRILKVDLDAGTFSSISIARPYDVVVLDNVALVAQYPSEDFGDWALSQISLSDDHVTDLPLDRTSLELPLGLARSSDHHHATIADATDEFSFESGIIQGVARQWPGLPLMAVSRDGALHAMASTDKVMIETPSFEVVKELNIGLGLVAFSPAGDVLFVASLTGHRLYAYDTTSWNELYIPPGGVSFASDPYGLIASADGQTAFILANSVMAFDVNGGSTFFGSPVTLEAEVSAVDPLAGAPGGTVAFVDGDTETILGYGTIEDGTVHLTTADLPAGTDSLRADYQGDELFAPARSDSKTMRVYLGTPPTVILDIQTTDKADVYVSYDGVNVDDGTVTLYDGDVAVGTADVNGGVASFDLNLQAGEHSLLAKFNGTENYSPGTSTQKTVLAPRPSALSLVQSSTSSVYGKKVTFTATVSGHAASDAGFVVFYEGNVSLTSAVVDASGNAVATIESLSAGTNDIYAKFMGSASLGPSSSHTISHAVEKAVTTIKLAAPATADWKHGVAAVATVTSNSGEPLSIGQVEFYSDGKIIDSEQVINGEAQLATSLRAGTHTLTAVYVGNENIGGSTSNSVTVHILVGLTSVTLTPSRDWEIKGDSITWTARVSVLRQAGDDPTGFIRFKEGKRVLASVLLTNNTATFTTSSLGVGEHNITATYVSDVENWTGSSDSAKTTIAAGTTVDLMVLYTNQATDDPDIPDFAKRVNDAVLGANEAFLNSHIPVKIRLVHSEAIAYHESGRLGVDLKRLATAHDGYMDGVQAMRKQYHADLVSLLEYDGDAGGLGYELTDVHDPTNAAYGFSVVLAGQAAGPTFSLAHELGHNFGATHDVQNSDGDGATSFSHGYRFRAKGKLYHDIMSYDPGRTIPFFSNPRIKYNGVAIGTANSADAARTITMTAPFVAKYQKG